MTAPHVSTRELSRPDFPAVVHTYTDLLRVLSTSADRTASPKHLAQVTERDGSNIRRDAQKLRDAGVIAIRADGAWTLTDKGGRWVVGQDVAAGAAQVGEASSNAPRWPADKIRRNPINRVVTTASVEGMADAIEGAEDILIPVRLTPADANGVRMLLAGERRWEGAKLCEWRGALPEALKAGIPFTEGEVSADDGALIAVIENTARKDLSPWEDAQLLKAAADGLGITNASELARRIGRAREGDRGGVRDVQTKLRVAREATPEAIATYEETGSWDRLRDSVTTPKAPTLSDLVAEHGVAALGSASSSDDPDQEELFERQDEALTPFAQLALVEIAWAMRWTPFTPADHETAVLTDGYYYMSDGMGQLVRDGYLEYLGWDLDAGRACVVRPTEKGFAWAAEKFDAGAPNLSNLIAWRERVGMPQGRRVPAHGDDEGFFTSTLNTAAKRKHLLTPRPTPTGPHVVNGVDYGNATRANDARRAIGLLPPLPPANYSGAKADPFSPGIGAQILGNHLRGLEGDDERPGDVTEAAPEPAAPSIPLGQVLKNMADEANEQKRHGLRATLEVLVDRLEPVLAILDGDRTEDGFVQIESDDAEWFGKELAEAVRWAEDAIAVTGVFDPLPGEDIARPDIGSPAIPIRQSITPDHIVCLFDGRKFKCLKRHLRTRYNMSPDEYRAKWKLPADYPMVAPNYAKAREDLARQMGLKAAAKS